VHSTFRFARSAVNEASSLSISGDPLHGLGQEARGKKEIGEAKLVLHNAEF